MHDEVSAASFRKRPTRGDRVDAFGVLERPVEPTVEVVARCSGPSGVSRQRSHIGHELADVADEPPCIELPVQFGAEAEFLRPPLLGRPARALMRRPLAAGNIARLRQGA